MATATEERRAHSERKRWSTAPQPGMTADEPRRFADQGTTDAPPHSDDDHGVLSKVRDRLFKRR
jgi:hypothetical protein